MNKWIIDMKIDHLKKAIKNIGKSHQQHIYISSCKNISDGLGGGEYIDLSEDKATHEAIKNILKIKLAKLINK